MHDHVNRGRAGRDRIMKVGAQPRAVLGRSARLQGALAVLADLIEEQGPGLWPAQ